MTRKVRPEGRSEEEAVAMKWIWVGVNLYRGGGMLRYVRYAGHACRSVFERQCARFWGGLLRQVRMR